MKIVLGIGIIVISVIWAIWWRSTTTEQTVRTPSPTIAVTTISGSPSAVRGTSRYQEYSPEIFAASSSQKRVYFFYASWCPTCQAADADINKHLDAIPQDAVIFRTNYDTESALKKQYGITYQHTFVLVDDQGNERAKWNGGNLQEILTQLGS